MEAELESMVEAQKPQQGADSIPMKHTDRGYNDHDPSPLRRTQEGRRGAGLLLEEAPREGREGLALPA